MPPPLAHSLRPLADVAVAAAIALAGAAGTLRAQAPPAAASAEPEPADASIDTVAIRAHTRFLADDLLRGRDTGTRGERLAAHYITTRLRALRVRGAAAAGAYRQPIPLSRATIAGAESRLVVRRGEDTTSFRHGRDFAVDNGGRGAFRDFAGDALFAGTAGLAHAALADAGPLDGKVVVVLGTLGREALTLVPDWIERGADGVVLLVPDAARFDRFARSREDFRLVIDANVDDPIWQPAIPTLIAGPAVTRALLADAGIAPDALDGQRPFAAVPLERRVEATTAATFEPVHAVNVAAVIPGADPERRDEFVAYTAHYDHLGVGVPDERGDSIYNGFSDNAAGVAMLLAIAEAMRADPPARSTLFLFFTGEERGLLGSTYYAAEPLVPLERTAAVINLDAGAPPAPPAAWGVAGGRASTLGTLASRVAERNGYTAEPSDASPNSDYWPFLRQGVPAVFLIPGQEWEGVDEDQERDLHRRWDRYHQPADEWAADFPLAGLKRYAEFALALGRAVANASETPRLLPGRP